MSWYRSFRSAFANLASGAGIDSRNRGVAGPPSYGGGSSTPMGSSNKISTCSLEGSDDAIWKRD